MFFDSIGSAPGGLEGPSGRGFRRSPWVSRRVHEFARRSCCHAEAWEFVAPSRDEGIPGAGFPETDPLARWHSRAALLKPPPGRARSRVPGSAVFKPREKTKLSASPAEFKTMKVVHKLVVLLIVGALSAVVASAATPEQAYLESCRKDPGVPVPVTVVSPTVGPEFNGGAVQLEFVVDEDGKPAAFSVKSTTDDRLAMVVVDAVKQWRFLPAEANGKRVATKVSLPVKIVDPAVSGDRYAAFE